jgi:hypothetical protein
MARESGNVPRVGNMRVLGILQQSDFQRIIKSTWFKLLIISSFLRFRLYHDET